MTVEAALVSGRADYATVLDSLEPHDLRHILRNVAGGRRHPPRVIDELMGHAGGQRGRDGSAIGPRYRWTTPEMEARAVAAIEQRLVVVDLTRRMRCRG